MFEIVVVAAGNGWYVRGGVLRRRRHSDLSRGISRPYPDRVRWTLCLLKPWRVRAGRRGARQGPCASQRLYLIDAFAGPT